MGDERTYNVEDRIRELGEDPQTAFANASANGMAGDVPPPTALPADPVPTVDPFVGNEAPPAAAAVHAGVPAAAPAKRPAPKLAPIVDTGTIADTQEAMPNLSPVQVTSAPLEPAASFSDLFTANRHIAVRSNSDFDDRMVREGYAPIVRALGLPDSENPGNFNQVDEASEARFGSMASPSDLASRAKQGATFFGNVYMADRPLQESLVLAEIKKRRASDPNFLPGVPDDPAGIHKYFIDQQKKGQAADEAVIQRSPGGLTGFGAALAGSTVGTFQDPVNAVMLAIPGGEGKSLLQIAARDALINGALELAQQPIVAHNKAELGENYTVGDAIQNVGSAALGGAAFGTVLHATGKGIGTVAGLFKALPETIRAKWGGRVADTAPVGSFFQTLTNHELTEFARDASTGKLTPDQTSAANVLERAEEVGSSSPYQPGAAGDGTHESALAQAIKDLGDQRTPEAAGFPSGPAADGTGAASPAAVLERPPAPSTVGRPQPSGDPEAAIQSFMGKVGHAENATGNIHAKNPRSSASGPAQFTDGTFRDYYRKVYGQDPGAHPAQELKDDPAVQGRLLTALTRDNAASLERLHESVNDGNLYLMHFLGSGDGAKVFRAEPGAAIESLVPEHVLEANPFLRGKSASEVIAWAHGKMGAHVPAVRAGAGPLEAASEDPRVAQLSGDALQLDNAVIGSDAPLNWAGRPDEDVAASSQAVPPMYARSYPAGEINVDANRFQFKAGGDGQGVTDRLRGVTQWNPLYAGRIVTWEDGAGRVFVADGHQRVGLANSLERQGHPPISMDAITLREADGVTAEDARTYAALKNIAEGTGTSIDAAKVIRDAGPHVLEHLPPRSALVRDGRALASLSDRAFGAVYNDVVPADYAAVIGHLLPHSPETHEAMIDLIAKLDPANRGQAESIVRQAIAAGIHTEEQVDLFGTHSHVTSLMLEKAKIQERVLAELRKMKLVHKTAAEGADALEAAGSSIARERSAEEAKANAQAIETINRLAYRAGPVSDAITAAARELKSGGKLGPLAAAAAERIRGLDLAELASGPDGSDVGALAGEAAGDNADGFDLDGSGRGSGAGEEGPQSPAEPRDPEQPSLLELEQATERFSDPNGKAVRQQADSLVHDLKVDVTRREAIRATTAALEDVKPGEFRAIEPFPKDEPGYRRFRYVAKDGTAVGGNYTLDGKLIEGFNIGDASNRAELGPTELRRLFDQLHAEHPEAKYVQAYRKSGARTKAGHGEQEIWLELTDKGIKRLDGPPAAADVAPARESDVAGTGQPKAAEGAQNASDGLPHVAEQPRSVAGEVVEAPKPGELWKVPEEDLHALADEKKLSDKEKLVKALGSEEAAKRFNVLDRARNGTFDTARADEASKQFDREFGDLTPEQERLIYGAGETDAQEDEIREVLKAYSDVIPGDDAGWSAYMAATAARNVSPEDLAKVPRGEATASVQAEFIRMGRAFQNLAARGIPTEDIPREMARALVSRAGWDPAAASEVIGSFAEDMAKMGERRPSSPALEGPPNPLDHGEQIDPAIADRQRQELALKSASPMRSIEEQHGTMGLHLFDHADEPTFRIGDEGGQLSAEDLLKDLEADDAAIKAIKDCL